MASIFATAARYGIGVDMPKLSKQELKTIFRAFGLITCMGISVVVCIGLGLLIGWALDRWLGTTPWMQLVFAILGCIAAIKTMYNMAKRVL